MKVNIAIKENSRSQNLRQCVPNSCELATKTPFRFSVLLRQRETGMAFLVKCRDVETFISLLD